MRELTGNERRHLRGLAHHLSPVVTVGKDGLTDAVAAEIDRALDAHELIKVKIAAGREERAETAGRIETRLGCREAGRVGSMAIFFRRHRDPERRRIHLPTDRR